MTVLVVGAGIAGVACARALRERGLPVLVRDRGRVPGGRMASRTIVGRAVDTGASYLTTRDEAFRTVVDDWLERGLARPWTDSFATLGPAGPGQTSSGPMRYGAPGGLRSLVVDLARGLDVQSGSAVETVGLGPVVDGTAYDAVVLAMPDPQAARLLDPAFTAEHATLADRVWTPSLALAAGFPTRGWDLDGAFVHDDPALEWIADDGARRGDGAAVLVAHSTPGFASSRLEDPGQAGPELVAALRRQLHLDAEPVWTHVHRWTYAKPAASRDSDFHLGAAGVSLCGDGWGRSKVEAAYLSGHRLGAALALSLG